MVDLFVKIQFILDMVFKEFFPAKILQKGTIFAII